MRIDVYKSGGSTVVAPWGRLMGGTDTDQLDERLHTFLREAERRVVLDLAHTRWINSAGIAVLIHHWKRFRGANAELVLSSLTQKTHHVLAISKLVTVFETFDSVEEAIAGSTSEPTTLNRWVA